MEIMDFNEMSSKGLIYKINKEVLHPLGLALMRDADTGTSDGCIIAPDGIWEYSQEQIERNEEKLKKFYNSFQI